MEKVLHNIKEAKKLIAAADHLVYISFPIVRDKKLILKSLFIIRESLVCAINAILQLEFFYKRVRLYKDPFLNFQTFINKIARRYSITREEIEIISKILTLTKNSKKNLKEFLRNDKLYLVDEDFRVKSLTLEQIKEYIFHSRSFIGVIERVVMSYF